MISDTERREAARRLREVQTNIIPGTKTEEHPIAGRIVGVACGYGLPDFQGLLGRLADLIEPSEPPYNLYTLYEAVLHRSPRCWECIEDDEVDELVNALLDICNAPGDERIQRPEPSEPKVRCVAEVKVDGERLEELVHDAAAELTGIDRDALLELEDEMFEDATGLALISQLEKNEELQDLQSTMAKALMDYARRIREALGVCRED